MSNGIEAVAASTVRSLEPMPRPTSVEESQAAAAPKNAVQPIESTFEMNDKTVISADDLKAAIVSLNQNLQKMNRNVHFSIDAASGKDVVRVTNRNTGETVRQLPSEETLQFLRNLDNMMGIIFDQKT